MDVFYELLQNVFEISFKTFNVKNKYRSILTVI